MGGTNLDFLESIGKNLDEVTAPVLKELNVTDVVTGAQRMIELTENRIAEEFNEEKIPLPKRDASYTIAWWKTRQVTRNVYVA